MASKQIYGDLWTFRLTGIVAAAICLFLVGELARSVNQRERTGRSLHIDISPIKMIWLVMITPKQSPEFARLLAVTPGQDPWRMSPNSLNRNRVIYNLASKSGFMDLGMLVLASMIMLYFGAVAMTSALQWQWRQLKTLTNARVSIEIAGTVRIEAKRGVIYFSGAKSDDQVYAYHWLPVRVRVEYAI